MDTVHVEARIQAAGPSQGVLSQLWMLPPDPKYGADWPASGEVRGRLLLGLGWWLQCRLLQVGCE